MRKSIVAVISCGILLWPSNVALAGSATWSANPASSDWNTVMNWTPTTIPNGAGDTATFDISNTNNVTISGNTQVDGITFAPPVNPYTIHVNSAGAPTLTLSGAGITNNSGKIPTFQVHGGGSPNGSMTFLNSSTAGNAKINNSGILKFANTSTAGNASIFSNFSLSFVDSATAGDASLRISLSTNVGFSNSSSAGNAIISPDDGTFVIFADNATAANATIATLGGITFGGSSTGGTAHISLATVFSTIGTLSISSHNPPGVTIGSLSGNGYVFLGPNNLAIGNDGRSTSFAGMIQNAGSLTKTGIGTLSLTGQNTYTGGTVINGGALLVLHDGALGTGSLTVNEGSTVGGTNSISGPVTVRAGAAILAGSGTMPSGALTVASSLTLESGSIVEIAVGQAGSHSTLSRSGGLWNFASNQAFTLIDFGVQPGTYNHIITGLASDPGTEGSWIITNPGFVGTFAYDGSGNVDLNFVAALRVTSISSLSNGYFLQGIGVPNQYNTIQASPDLSDGSFTFVGNFLADSTGAFHSEVTSADTVTKSFYRVTFP